MDYSASILPILIITLISIAIILFRNEEVKSINKGRPLFAFGLFILSASYAYGSYITLNCALDSSEPEVFNTSIVDKRISTGKTTFYYLKLAAWGPEKEVNEVSVPQKQYESTDLNDEIKVYLMKGKFDVPWFQIDTN